MILRHNLLRFRVCGALALLFFFEPWASPLNAQTSVTYPAGQAPLRMAFDGTYIWITNRDARTVTEVRAFDGAFIGSYPVATAPAGIVTDGAHIWVTDLYSNLVSEWQDPSGTSGSGAYVGSYPTGPTPTGIAFDGQYIWVANSGSNTVTKFVDASGAVAGSYFLGQSPSELLFDGIYIWATEVSGTVAKLRASTGELIGTYSSGSNPQSMAFDGTNIWILNVWDGTVSKLLASTGLKIGSYPTQYAQGIAFDGKYIWIAGASSSGGGFLTKLLPSDGSNLGTYPLPYPASQLLFDGSSFWALSNYWDSITKIVFAAPPPVITTNGVVNAATLTTSVSPGELLSVFGANFTAQTPAVATVLPLPTSLAGASVLVNGVAAPLLYAGPTQINFQLPSLANGTLQISVRGPSGQSAGASLAVQTVAPAIFEYNGTHAVAQNSDFSLNGSQNPAKAGDFVTLYGTGAGPVTNAPLDGLAAPIAPLALVSTSPLSATIGGQPAKVLFAGLSPGLVGLLQMDLVIPSGLTPGDYPITITIGNSVSTPAVISIKN